MKVTIFQQEFSKRIDLIFNLFSILFYLFSMICGFCLNPSKVFLEKRLRQTKLILKLMNEQRLSSQIFLKFKKRRSLGGSNISS